MKKQQFIDYIKTQYNVEAEYPWDKYPSYAAFKHRHNQKWFALMMDVPANKLNKNDTNTNIVSVVNVKIAPELLGSIRTIKGVYPAYHMNKEHWVSISLESDMTTSELKQLIDDSYHLTK